MMRFAAFLVATALCTGMVRAGDVVLSLGSSDGGLAWDGAESPLFGLDFNVDGGPEAYTLDFATGDFLASLGARIFDSGGSIVLANAAGDSIFSGAFIDRVTVTRQAGDDYLMLATKIAGNWATGEAATGYISIRFNAPSFNYGLSTTDILSGSLILTAPQGGNPVVPEPTSALMMAGGLIGVAGLGLRRK